jgi:uncharacterized surface protein with fasciclin (FAS1) repeats
MYWSELMGIKRLKISASISMLALGAALIAQAPASQAATGNIPLSQVLDISRPALDNNWNDFDVLTGAINFVLKAKPASSVKVLADGEVALTAFIPTDRAFRTLVKNLKGKFLFTEAKILEALATLGVDTIEKVLLYHVVLGDPINSTAALAASGASLTTAETEKFSVLVRGKRIYLLDIGVPKSTPKVILSGVDLNIGNKQIAHTIDAVLIPTLA